MINYKQILEAVNRGIQLVLDDFDDDEVQNVKSKQIQNRDYTKEYLDFQKLIVKSKNKEITKPEFDELVRLFKLSGLKYTVNTKDELKVIARYIITYVDCKANLNWIDTSRITDMSYFFMGSEFKGDISEWDVSNVESMYSMFADSEFNGDISKWNVSKVNDMRYMFSGCRTFNHDISMWDVWRTNKDDIVKTGIFAWCPINKKYRPKFNNG